MITSVFFWLRRNRDNWFLPYNDMLDRSRSNRFRRHRRVNGHLIDKCWGCNESQLSALELREVSRSKTIL